MKMSFYLSLQCFIICFLCLLQVTSSWTFTCATWVSTRARHCACAVRSPETRCLRTAGWRTVPCWRTPTRMTGLTTSPRDGDPGEMTRTDNPVNAKQLYSILYNVGSTSKTLGRRCINVIQMFCVCWEPSKHKTFVWHLYNVGPTSETLGQRCINVMQIFCAHCECWRNDGWTSADYCTSVQVTCKVSRYCHLTLHGLLWGQHWS